MIEHDPGRGNGPDVPHPVVQLVAKVETPFGPLRGRVTVYTGPIRLAGLIPPLQALTEGLVSLMLNQAREDGQHVSCRAGCAACCCLMPALSIPESFYLRDLVASLPPEKRQEILRRFEHIVGELESRGLLSQLERPDRTDEENLRLAGEYFRLGLSCPFLENEFCIIHPARPLACREYHVTTPAEWCADPYSQPVKTLKLPVAVPVVVAYLTADLLSEPARLIPLSLALRWTAKNADIHERTWPGRWLFEHFLTTFNSMSKRGSIG